MIGHSQEFGAKKYLHDILYDFPPHAAMEVGPGQLEIHIGYTMKRRGIRDLDHRGNRLFRRPERVARGRLIRFPRWSKSRIPRLFHRIRYLYYTSLSVCLSATAKYCSRVIEAYRSRQDRRHRRPVNILGQRVVWMITLVIAPSLCYFPVVEPLWALIRLSLRRQCCSLL